MERVGCACPATVAVKQRWAQVTQRSLGTALCLERVFRAKARPGIQLDWRTGLRP